MANTLAPFSFESHSIRVLTDDHGSAWFVARDVASALGYAKPENAVATHCKRAKSLKALATLNRGSDKNQWLALEHNTKLIPEGDVYRLITRSNLPTAEAFESLVMDEILPSIRKTGHYEAPTTKRDPAAAHQYRVKLAIARAAKSMLRLSDTSTSRMLSAIAESEGVSSAFLPSYVDESLTRALTALLKEHGSTVTAQAANKVLVELGMLEELTRIGSGGTVKKFKSLTTAGLAYGRNETSPQNPRETQPLYFVDRFAKLLDLIQARLPASAEAAA